MPKKLSIIVPVYNEERTILNLLDKVIAVSLPQDLEKQFIIVNDGSSDQTENKISDFIGQNPGLNIKYQRHSRNLGKGAAIKTALPFVSGNYVLIQDADLEYDPGDFNQLVLPAVRENFDVIYGSRFLSANSSPFAWHFFWNRLITKISNLFSGLKLTDVGSGYKLFRTDVIKNLRLQEKRFGFEIEVTAKIARLPGLKFKEIPINYHGRNYANGKKIHWWHTFRAFYCLVKYNLIAR